MIESELPEGAKCLPNRNTHSDRQMPFRPWRRLRAVNPHLWPWLLLMFVVGFDLRATMGAPPALMTEIGDDLDLSAFMQGMTTSLAIAFMCASAPFGPLLGRAIGYERALSVVLATLTLTLCLRLWISGPATLMASVGLAGTAMGVGAGVVPALIYRHIPRMQGAAAGVFSTGLALGVALTAGSATNLSAWLGGWRPALALPALITASSLLVWETVRPRSDAFREPKPASPRITPSPWRSRTGWLVSLYVASPMLVGFTLLAWLVPYLVEEGWTPGRAAALFVTFQISQLATMLALPPIFDRLEDKRHLLGLPVVLTAAGLVGLTIPNLVGPEMMVPIMGIGIGGATSLGMALVPAASKTQEGAGRLGSMVFTVAFAVSAVCPAAIGAARDSTGNFLSGFIALAVCAIATLGLVRAIRPSLTGSGGYES